MLINSYSIVIFFNNISIIFKFREPQSEECHNNKKVLEHFDTLFSRIGHNFKVLECIEEKKASYNSDITNVLQLYSCFDSDNVRNN